MDSMIRIEVWREMQHSVISCTSQGSISWQQNVFLWWDRAFDENGGCENIYHFCRLVVSSTTSAGQNPLTRLKNHDEIHLFRCINIHELTKMQFTQRSQGHFSILACVSWIRAMNLQFKDSCELCRPCVARCIWIAVLLELSQVTPLQIIVRCERGNVQQEHIRHLQMELDVWFRTGGIETLPRWFR